MVLRLPRLLFPNTADWPRSPQRLRAGGESDIVENRQPPVETGLSPEPAGLGIRAQRSLPTVGHPASQSLPVCICKGRAFVLSTNASYPSTLGTVMSKGYVIQWKESSGENSGCLGSTQ